MSCSVLISDGEPYILQPELTLRVKFFEVGNQKMNLSGYTTTMLLLQRRAFKGFNSVYFLK